MKSHKKRRMPPHIVLPNGMWRFVKKGTKKATKVFRAKARKKSARRSVKMTRRRKSYSSRKGNGFGIPNTNKLIKIGAFSAGAVLLGATLLPNVSSNIKGAAGGFAAGGPIGAVIGYLAAPTIANIAGGVVNNDSSNGGWN